MPRASSHIRIQAVAARVLANLKQGDALENSNRYERVMLQKLQLVETLVHDIAEGPALDLSRQDEFVLHRPGNHHREAQYVVNQRGQLSLLHRAWDDLDDVLRYIPVAHLSPRVQAFDKVFRQPDHLLESKDAYHSAVQQAVADARLDDIGRPKDPFHSPLRPPTSKLTFTSQEAQEFLAVINRYLRHLAAIVKHAEVRKAQRSRQSQAEKHYQTLQMLFRKTLKVASPALMVYLDLEGPNPDASSNLKASYAGEPANESRDTYQQLNNARKAFLKPRNHSPLFHGLISYAWKYRYSYGRGLTCMMVLFFDAKRQTQRYSLTHALGAHWERVAGDGSKYSSPITDMNTVTQEQYFGLLDAEDPHAKKGLGTLAVFMGLYQLYVKPTPPKYMNTLDTSRMPGVTPTKRKPQKKSQETQNSQQDTANKER